MRISSIARAVFLIDSSPLRAAWRWGLSGLAQALGQIVDAEHLALGESTIARSMCSPARARCRATRTRAAAAAPRVDAADVGAEARVVPGDEVIDQERDVLPTLAQRRDHDGEHVDAVVEVLAEAPGLRSPGARSRCVAARMRTSTFVAGVAQRRMRSSWSTRRSFTWSWMRQLADLVEEQRAAGGLLEEPGAIRARVGEGAFSVAEELALQERLGDGAAVDRHERAVPATSAAWIARATSSLPTPLSPVTSAVVL
jgi:hypothetical protein